MMVLLIVLEYLHTVAMKSILSPAYAFVMVLCWACSNQQDPVFHFNVEWA